MIFRIFLSYLPYAIVTAYTPGPNNILALNTGSSRGWKSSGPVLAGMFAGFFCVMTICALGCFQISRYLDGFVGVMKYIGALYIVWLAVHIARSKPAEDGAQVSASFFKGFFLQFVNVKIILYAITIYTGYVMPVQSSLPVLLLAALFNTAVGASGMLAWALAGSIFQRCINRYYRAFNFVMALILLESAVQLFLM
ncbi:LysE family transporter [Bacilliculturomica massiliensis]|uniref:LysE family transporter n=1 Tax=Bacilliculturomica massiliensis TaxID=1917867 RepID=UPI00102FC8A6|nr:LysE family transporter [Bacilliculturomica massiliensis]